MSAFYWQSTNHHVSSYNKHAMKGAILFAQNILISKPELVENWVNRQAGILFVNDPTFVKQIILYEKQRRWP